MIALIAFVVLFVALSFLISRTALGKKSKITTLGGSFMVSAIATCAVLSLAGGTSPSSSSASTWSGECKDKDSGILGFRKSCLFQVRLFEGNTGFRRSDEKNKTWCSCFEKNFQFWLLLDATCEIHTDELGNGKLINMIRGGSKQMAVACGDLKERN